SAVAHPPQPFVKIACLEKLDHMITIADRSGKCQLWLSFFLARTRIFQNHIGGMALEWIGLTSELGSQVRKAYRGPSSVFFQIPAKAKTGSFFILYQTFRLLPFPPSTHKTSSPGQYPCITVFLTCRPALYALQVARSTLIGSLERVGWSGRVKPET